MILEQIVTAKKQEIQELLSQLKISQMEKEISALPPARNFQQAIGAGSGVKLIAEIKHRSPAKGVLCKNFNHRRLAAIYRDNGAAAVSVLTDSTFFGGHLNYLQEVRQIIELPLLRKDFILDPLQVYQSRLFGADAILLIAALLRAEELIYLNNLAQDCGLQTLVEVHTADELQWVLDLGINMIGINNRDLQSFHTNLTVTARLVELINRPDVTVVSESGIHSFQHMRFLQEQGVNAALVGEALVISEDIPAKVRKLVKGGGTVDVSVCTH